MKKYRSFFRLRFAMGLQYRAAALAGISTQFFWGIMEILAFYAFYKTGAEAFPMSFSATSTYIWLQQSFFIMFTVWLMENEIFDAILNGNIAYELCRPVHLYYMWFVRNLANRMASAMLRCVPIFVVASFLPKPYGLSAPADLLHFLLFLLTLGLALFVTVAMNLLIYMLSFFTISAAGLRMIFVAMMEFFTGAIIPLPFFPEKVRFVLELLPFAAMQNVPLRIYSGSMGPEQMAKAVFLQCFWLAVLICAGLKLWAAAEKRVVLQGG